MPSSDSGEKRGSPSYIDLPCMPPDRPVAERLDEPLCERVEYCLYEGNPCILFVDWDYAEDWSGEFVQVMGPEALSAAPRVSVSEFWVAVRRVQSLNR
jgi:hypothetical protein